MNILKIFFSLILITLLITISLILINTRIKNTTSEYIFTDIDKLPKNKVGLLLGTALYVENGKKNLFMLYRIQSAIELLNKGQIEYILVSGDNETVSYNEPMDIYNELIEQGVPENKIFLDYAGFRTLDSVIRADKVFDQNEYTIISQRFQLERAIYIARDKNINAIGYTAKDVYTANGLKTYIREVFARILMFIDLNIKNTQPKFLGDIVEIKESSEPMESSESTMSVE